MYTEDPKLLNEVEDTSFDIEDIQRQWAEDAGEEPDIVIPKSPDEPVDLSTVDDWENMNGN
ncbi:hypothetical protein fHeYen801_016 [Yersinia phage fHe-Yen8-01]|nr:hypothetical protein fHeYen801_016 [Yersinia phage fHe-Yen8-01]